MEAVGVEERQAAASLLDDIIAQQRTMAAAQARLASMMITFSDLRRTLDEADQPPAGARPPGAAKPGEFAATEIAMALSAQTHLVQCDLAQFRRVRSGLPEVWALWQTGTIDLERVKRIDTAARRIVNRSTLIDLDDQVPAIAATKTPKQLTSWLDRFVARHEAHEHTERHRRAHSDRRVSATFGLDGVAWISGGVDALGASAIDLRLTSLAQACGAADPRSMDQRRADLFAGLLLGRIVVEKAGDRSGKARQPDKLTNPAASIPTTRGSSKQPDNVSGTGLDDSGWPFDPGFTSPSIRRDQARQQSPQDAAAGSEDRLIDHRLINPDVTIHQLPGAPVTIGVVVPIQSLIGDSETPGELLDRSASVPASVIRQAAAQPGTLFYRLLTDPRGHLLDVTEYGRFPTDRLGFAVRARAGSCENPVCTVPASRCDIDHHEPVPRGPTHAGNLGPECRRDHRGITHAGFATARMQQVVEWTTPTQHHYHCADDPLPLDTWADDPIRKPGNDSTPISVVFNQPPSSAEIIINDWLHRAA